MNRQFVKGVPGRSFYERLGIGPRASQDEIKRAYRRAVTKHHPDRFAAGSKEWETANSVVQELHTIFEVLSNPQERARYDAELHEASWDRLEERARLVKEQRKLEAEARSAEAARLEHVRTQQRSQEQRGIRERLGESARRTQVMQLRESEDRCVMCGKKLSMVDRLARRRQHQQCTEYVDE